MKNMKRCPKHKMYPTRFDKCPQCHADAKSEPLVRTKEDIARAIQIGLERGDIQESQIKK